MRRLLLLRHAKSARPAGIADHDRPLAPHGRDAMPLVADLMTRERLLPDAVLVSTARRTRETFAALNAVLKLAPPIFTDGIYEASEEQLAALVRKGSPTATSLMIVGHNPGMADLASSLSDTACSDADALVRLGQDFPTAALAVIDFDVSGWDEIEPGHGTLRRFITPAMLGGVDED